MSRSPILVWTWSTTTIVVLSITAPALGQQRDRRAQMFSAAKRAEEHANRGELDQASQDFERALDLSERLSGPQAATTAKYLNNLAVVYCRMRRYDDAEKLYQRSLETTKMIYGDDHVNVATCLSNLAGVRYETSRYQEAEALYQESLRIYQARHGPNHPDVASCLNHLARVHEAISGQQAAARRGDKTKVVPPIPKKTNDKTSRIIEDIETARLAFDQAHFAGLMLLGLILVVYLLPTIIALFAATRTRLRSSSSISYSGGH